MKGVNDENCQRQEIDIYESEAVYQVPGWGIGLGRLQGFQDWVPFFIYFPPKRAEAHRCTVREEHQ